MIRFSLLTLFLCCAFASARPLIVVGSYRAKYTPWIMPPSPEDEVKQAADYKAKEQCQGTAERITDYLLSVGHNGAGHFTYVATAHYRCAD